MIRYTVWERVDSKGLTFATVVDRNRKIDTVSLFLFLPRPSTRFKPCWLVQGPEEIGNPDPDGISRIPIIGSCATLGLRLRTNASLTYPRGVDRPAHNGTFAASRNNWSFLTRVQRLPQCTQAFHHSQQICRQKDRHIAGSHPNPNHLLGAPWFRYKVQHGRVDAQILSAGSASSGTITH